MATRALRYLIQHASFDTNLSFKIVSHFASLSILLKAALEQQVKQQNSIAHKFFKVELSLAMALMFAQNPLCRRHILYELRAFPLWMSNLRIALLNHLSSAEVEYFGDVLIVDCTGYNLMHTFTLESVSKGSAAKRALEEQEERLLKHLLQQYNYGHVTDISDFVGRMNTNEFDPNDGKLKSFLLSYALHVTFDPPKASLTMYQQYEDIQKGTYKEPEEEMQEETAIITQEDLPIHKLSFDSPRQEAAVPLIRTTTTISPAKEKISPAKSVASVAPMLNKPQGPAVLQESPKASPKPDRPRRVTDSFHSENSPSAPALQEMPFISPNKASPFVEQTSPEKEQEEKQEKLANSLRTSSQSFSPYDRASMEISTQTASFDPSRKKLNGKIVLYGVGKKKQPKLTAEQAKLERNLTMPKLLGKFFKKHLQLSPVNRYPLFRSPVFHTNEGLVLRPNKKPSPKPLIKGWESEDARDGDAFSFDIPFDDISTANLELLLKKCQRHHMNIKKMFVTCPQGTNGKGRRTFLDDMLHNIMPQLYHMIEALIHLSKEHGEENIRMPMYLWKGKDKPDKGLNHVNLHEIVEFLRLYLAKNQQDPHGFERENEFAERMFMEQEDVALESEHTVQQPLVQYHDEPTSASMHDETMQDEPILPAHSDLVMQVTRSDQPLEQEYAEYQDQASEPQQSASQVEVALVGIDYEQHAM